MKKQIIDYAVSLLVCLAFWVSLFLLARPFLERNVEAEETTKKEVCEEVVVVERKQVEQEEKVVCLGEFVLTAYCGENYPHVCNDGDATKTATGTKPTAGRTIAVDPSVIPYGTKVYINGKEYIAEDCGGSIKGKRIDIFFDEHQTALDFGVQYANVEVVR